MAEGTIRVKGLRELQRAFRQADGDLRRELRRELRRVAEPVAEEARRLAGRFGARTVSGIRPRSSRSSAFVTQTRRKVTGAHPEFGGILMATVLLPALADKEPEVLSRLEDMLDRIGRDAGF